MERDLKIAGYSNSDGLFMAGSFLVRRNAAAAFGAGNHLIRLWARMVCVQPPRSDERKSARFVTPRLKGGADLLGQFIGPLQSCGHRYPSSARSGEFF
jgi:hypothetical protein